MIIIIIHENNTQFFQSSSLSFSMADRLVLNNDELSSTGLDSAGVGETDSGLSNAHDDALAGCDSNDGDDCIRSLRGKLPLRHCLVMHFSKRRTGFSKATEKIF